MNRRDALRSIVAMASAAIAIPARTVRANSDDETTRAPGTKITGMGLVEYCLGIRRRVTKRQQRKGDLFDPLRLLELCHAMGVGGIQMNLGVRDEAYCEQLRSRSTQYGMYIEGITSPPRDDSDIKRFELQIRTAARAGAKAVRTVIIPGRRYEFFDSLKTFREYEERGAQALERSVPILEKHRLPLAVENHKDHRLEQRVALLKRIDSEFVGACIDTGNNLALLEDPVEVAKALVPWAKSVHIKDQAVAEYDDGFLLGDVPLGEGCIDLPAIVGIIRKRHPHVRFSLELITRDALKVPCLAQSYWRTFPDVPARDLAATLALVRRHDAGKTLQDVGTLSPQQQVELEESNVRRSLRYARNVLEI